MTQKVHGVSFPGQHLSGGLNYYTVRTTLDIRPSADKDLNDAAQKRLNKLVETISLRAQPVIMGRVVESVEAKADVIDLPAVSALPGTDVTIYVLKFAIEHNFAWEVEGNNPTLAESLNGVEGFVFTVPTTANNVAVTYASDL